MSRVNKPANYPPFPTNLLKVIKAWNVFIKMSCFQEMYHLPPKISFYLIGYGLTRKQFMMLKGYRSIELWCTYGPRPIYQYSERRHLEI